MPSETKKDKKSINETRKRALVRALKTRAELFRFMGEYDRGIKDIYRAIKFCAEIAPRSVEIPALFIDLADTIARGKGRYEYAAKIMKKNLQKVKKSKNAGIHAQTLETLGIISFYQCRYSKSLKYFLSALKTYRELNRKRSIAAISGNIGLVYRELGDLSKALKYYRKYMIISRSIGNKVGLVSAYALIGVIHRIKGNLDKALKYQNQCILLCREIGDIEVLNTALNNTGNIFYNKGDLTTAFKYYTESLELTTRLQDQRGNGFAYSNLGAIYYDRGDLENALNCVGKFYKISRTIGFKRGIAIAANQIASMLLEKNDLFAAKKYLKESERIYVELGNKLDLADVYANISRLHILRSNYDDAIKYARKGLAMAQCGHAIEYEINALRILGIALFRLTGGKRSSIKSRTPARDAKCAMFYLEKSISLARRQHLQFELAMSLYELAKIYREIKGEKAAALREKSHALLEEAKEIFIKAGAITWIDKTERLTCGAMRH